MAQNNITINFNNIDVSLLNFSDFAEPNEKSGTQKVAFPRYGINESNQQPSHTAITTQTTTQWAKPAPRYGAPTSPYQNTHSHTTTT
jgi:hypothetical protein